MSPEITTMPGSIVGPVFSPCRKGPHADYVVTLAMVVWHIQET